MRNKPARAITNFLEIDENKILFIDNEVYTGLDNIRETMLINVNLINQNSKNSLQVKKIIFISPFQLRVKSQFMVKFVERAYNEKIRSFQREKDILF
jgi:hypothetical protein